MTWLMVTKVWVSIVVMIAVARVMGRERESGRGVLGIKLGFGEDNDYHGREEYPWDGISE